MTEQNEENLKQEIAKLNSQLKTLSISNFSPQPSNIAEADEIDFSRLFKVLWKGKKVIIAITSVISIVTIVVLLLIPNIYRSSALLLPAEESKGGGLAALAGQFGGLANLAGINLGETGTDKTVLAIEVLKSRLFINEFIKKYDITVELIASHGWDEDENELLIDSDDFDVKKQIWVRRASGSKKVIPSDIEAYEEFTKIFSVTQDKSTSFVTISIDSYSPSVSKKWVDWLIMELNTHIKEMDIREAERSIGFLERQLKETPIAEMQTIFYQLIQEQVKTVMLAKSRDEYAFRTIDPSIIPEEKHSPKRALILFLSILFSGFCSSVFVLIRSEN